MSKPAVSRISLRRLGSFSVACLLLASAGLAQPAPVPEPEPEASKPATETSAEIQVDSIKWEGNNAVGKGDLENAIVTKANSWLPWGRKEYLNRDVLQDDVKRIKTLYAARGYPDATVSDLDLQFNDTQDKVKIRFVITEGEPVIVESLTFAGVGPIPENRMRVIRQRFPVKEGSPRDIAAIRAGHELAVRGLRDRGFPYATVTVREAAGSAPRTVALTYDASPGPKAIFGPIEISGNNTVSDDVIRRQLLYKPGDLFRESLLLASQRKLSTLGLFEPGGGDKGGFVNIEEVAQEQKPVEVATRVTVGESKHQHVELQGGFGTEEKARGEIQYRHVNFFGGGRTGSVRGRWSSLDRGVWLDFHEPYFLRNNWSLAITGQNRYVREPKFEEEQIGGRAQITYRRLQAGALPRETRSTSVSFSYINQYESFSIDNDALEDLTLRDDLIALGLDPTTGAGKGTLIALAVDAQRNTVDSVLDPKRGYLASAHFEHAGRLLRGDFSYREFSAEGRYYQRVMNNVIVAQRIRFGSLGSKELSDVPFYKRYFLGGSTSLRGWGRFEVGPLTPVNPETGGRLTLGGLTMLESATEIRAPIWGKLEGVLFFDAGNVWLDSWDVQFGDMRYDVGPGLRYRTPIGPIRFDFAYQLTPIEDLLVNGEVLNRRWRMHFSIGQAF
jgi:outer membrane protein assembly complex protein YaeT